MRALKKKILKRKNNKKLNNTGNQGRSESADQRINYV